MPRALSAMTIALSCILAGCNGGSGSSSTSSSSGNSTGSAAGSATGAAQTASISGTGGTATAGSATSGSPTSGGSGNGSTGGGPCASGAIWIGNLCAVSTCSVALNGAGCVIGDGGLGRCLGDSCIDVRSDSLNCGTPGTLCASGLDCVNGVCVGNGGCTPPGTGCPSGSTCQSDGRTCLSGICTAIMTGLQCAQGVCCGTTCTSLVDTQNCGGCGIVCPTDKTCSEIFTQATGYTTACADCSVLPDNAQCGSDGSFCCGGTCVPKANADSLNCGQCGLICPGGAAGTCAAGICTSTCDSLGCPDQGDCVTLESQSGTPIEDECLPTACSPGQNDTSCLLPSGEGGRCCGGTSCLDVSFDPANCGDCGTVCPAGKTCLFGGCQTLPSSPASCAVEADGDLCHVDAGLLGACCSGTCTDPGVDSNNCGSCGNVCPTGSVCAATDANAGHAGSYCVQPGTSTQVVCRMPSDCPDGLPCVLGICAPSCTGRAEGEQCLFTDGGPVFGSCCADACADTASDPENCGGCGVICPVDFTCKAGACVEGASAFVCGGKGMPTCPAGYSCDGTTACAILDCIGKPNGDPCAYGPNLGGECCGGVCAGVNGTDPNNCGGCGLTCAAGSICEQGICYPAQGFGECTPACPAGQTCVGGVCATALCLRNTDTCVAADGQPGTCFCGLGACIDPETDPNNCDNCGTPCPAGDSCVGGACQSDACNFGSGGSFCALPALTSGCCANFCVDTQTDSANCGACGAACPSGTTCQSGVCG